jgi:hypothetical protein
LKTRTQWNPDELQALCSWILKHDLTDWTVVEIMDAAQRAVLRKDRCRQLRAPSDALGMIKRIEKVCGDLGLGTAPARSSKPVALPNKGEMVVLSMKEFTKFGHLLKRGAQFLVKK